MCSRLIKNLSELLMLQFSVLYFHIAAHTISREEEGIQTSMLNIFMLWDFLSLAHCGYIKVIGIAAWYLGKL